jgi:hypothetical protein
MSKTHILTMLFAYGISFTAFSPKVLADSSATTDKQVSNSDQTVKSTDGNVFMEELPTPVKKPETPQVRVRPDLRSLGVPVDPNGNIVPLINKETGPVLPFYSQTEQTFEPIYQNGYPQFGYPITPYGYGPYRVAPGFARPFGWGAPYGYAPRLMGPAPSLFLNRGVYAAPWFAPPVLAPPINNPYAPNLFPFF